MPAHRSRTERWRELLQQIADRGGGIEFSVARPEDANAGESQGDLMWRVRLLHVTDSELLVDMPSAAGQPVHMVSGLELVAVMTVGQNKWIFRTRTIGQAPLFPGSRATGLKLSAPEKVERCYRRDFLRVSTAELRLPHVDVWPLLQPSSVVMAEAANKDRILEAIRTGTTPAEGSEILPEVGPKFSAQLMNVGGGGVGLLVGKDDAAAAGRTKLCWMRVHLQPHVPLPLGITAKLVHTHLDSGQNLYVGAAFEFAFNPAHREFVVNQIVRYVDTLSRGCGGQKGKMAA